MNLIFANIDAKSQLIKRNFYGWENRFFTMKVYLIIWSMHFLNSGYKISSERFRRIFSRLRNYSLKIHLHDYHNFSGNAYYYLHMQSYSVKQMVNGVHCNKKIQPVLLFKLTFGGGHYHHPSRYCLPRFLKSWNVIIPRLKQSFPLLISLLPLQVNDRQTLGKLHKQPQLFKICIATTCFHSCQSFRHLSFNFILLLVQGMLINQNFPRLLFSWPKIKSKKKLIPSC